jgi:hypothetical protein
MGAGSNGQGSGGGIGGKGGNPQGNKPSGSGAQNTTTCKVSFYYTSITTKNPRPAKTLRFIEKGFDVMPSPIAVRNRMAETSEAAPLLCKRAASNCTRKPGTVGPERAIIKHLAAGFWQHVNLSTTPHNAHQTTHRSQANARSASAGFSQRQLWDFGRWLKLPRPIPFRTPISRRDA